MFVRKWGIWVAALLVLIAITGVPVAAYTIDGHTFAHGIAHTVTAAAGTDPTNYCMAFTLSNATGTSSGDTIYTDGTTNGEWTDIRFTDASDTVLPHWIEVTGPTTACVWVKVGTISTSGTTIRFYYDSDTATTQTSTGAGTGVLYDDFNDGAIDTAVRWTDKTGSTESGGVLTVSTAVWAERGLASKTSFGGNTSVRASISMNAGDNSYFGYETGSAQYLTWRGGGTDAAYSRYWSTSEQVSTTNYALADGYHTLEVSRGGTTSAKYYDGSTLAASHTTGVTPNALPCFIGTIGTATIACDWVFVRPYVASEPTHGAYTSMAPPTAAFSADTTSGDTPLTVHFTDASTNSPTSWAWDFDNDGDIDSTVQNPTYEYAADGVYTVKLTASNAYGSDDETKTDYITASTPYAVPVAAFSANVTSGYTPLAVAFTDTSTGPAAAWAWDFDNDGDMDSADQNTTHVYADAGTYTVNLTVTNPAGTDSEVKTGYITAIALPDPPVASFAADITAGHAPLTVQFTDTSTGSPTAWAWDFDGDAVADSTEQNPTHEYAANGTYTVTLQVSNAGGTDLETKTDYIYVGELTARLLRASFSYTTPIGTAPFSVSFTDETVSNGTYMREWDFGDGTTSFDAAPVHEYATAGKYDVELVVSSDYVQDKSTARKAVMAYPAAAVSPLPTTTYGAHMTEIMESNWNVSVIGPIIPRAYTDALTPLAGDTGVGDYILWGIIWSGVFMILFVRQGTSWLVLLLGLVTGAGILRFMPPEFAHVGFACAAVACGGFFVVFILGRYRAT